MNIIPPVIKIALLASAVGTIWAMQIYLKSSPVPMLEEDPTESASGGSSLTQGAEASVIRNARPKARATRGESIQKLDINKATSQQIETLPGVGRKLAEAIIGFRDRQGHFQDLEQLKEVRGIGETRFSTISSFFTLGGAEEIPLQVPPSEE